MENTNKSRIELTFSEKAKDYLLVSLFHFEDFLFSKLHRIDITPVFHEELTVDNQNSLSHATHYQATTCKDLREVVSEARKTLIPFETFIDIGCGKGKACIYISKKMKFKQIIGVDFSQPLIDIAVQNNRKVGRANVVFFQGDAIEFRIPDGNNIIFMNNPFDNIVLEAFIKNNMNHFKRFSSIIAYVNDRQRRCLAALGFETIYRNQRSKSLYRFYQQPASVSEAFAAGALAQPAVDGVQS